MEKRFSNCALMGLLRSRSRCGKRRRGTGDRGRGTGEKKTGQPVFPIYVSTLTKKEDGYDPTKYVTCRTLC
jgi:hypothetical protein